MKRYSVLVLSVVLVAAAATAQGSLGLGPELGIYKSRDADNMRVMGGAALRIKLSQALGVEGSINYREEDYRNGAVSVKSWPVMVTGLLYPIPSLYGAIGAGWYNTSIDYNIPTSAGFLGGPVTLSGETKQEFGWHFGGGMEVPVGPSLKLIGDIRYVFLNYDFSAFPGSNGINSDFYVITAGLLFGL